MQESIMTTTKVCSDTWNQQNSLVSKGLCLASILALAGLTWRPASAGVTDISSQPLATTPTVQAKPNLLFILDNSGSMDSAYMPDDMSNSGAYGYRSTQCNGVAYDPSVVYSPPVTSTGTPYANATFTAAKSDGYNSSSGTTNLTGSYYYTYQGSQPKMGWVYTTAGLTSNTFTSECFSTIGNSPGSSVFTKVTLSSSSSEAQNYANWYSFYRKRYLLMRTAMGRAISALDSSYRVGFSTISDTSATEGTNYFRDVKDFDATQKTNFYSSLYSVPPTSYTPLRAALSKAGRYFANKAPGQTYDPMQYACQRNYSLLSTDGYWNTNDETSSFGPFIVNANTKVGNQDSAEARPMRDGSVTIVTTVTPYTAAATRDQQSNTQTRTRNWNRTYTTYATSKGTGGCSSSKYLKTTQNQVYGQSQTQKFLTPQQTTYRYSNTLVTTDGVTTSNTNSTATADTWVIKAGASTTVSTTDTGDASASTTYSNSGSPTKTCVSSTGTDGYSTASAGSWGSWSPSLTYSYINLSIGSYTAGSPTVTPTYSGGSTDSLADVAEYYWKTDLRSSTFGNCTSSSSGSSRDVCEDLVRPVGDDIGKYQHMNTFTIGLGTSGTITYDKNYLSQTTGEYADLVSGALRWPNPSNGGEGVNIDDLWHAAVNGRGRYYSALSASELSEAISGVVSTIESIPGAAAAAATSTLELVSGNTNYVFSASYTTKTWTGDLKAFLISGDATIAATPSWSAQEQIDAQPYASRKIYFKGSGGLTLFEYDNLGSLKTHFDDLCSKPVVSGQCATLTTADKVLANSGTNLVNYLRGDRSYESAISGTTSSALFRTRDHVLGDIINGAPVYVGKSTFAYADSGHADFVATTTSRKPVIYVAANDGMLHAISADSADGGKELWAYIPTAVMEKLYKLADNGYANKHQYYVDGAPVVVDAKIGGAWKTILVGGLNSGGSSYYALDITDPTQPAVLWEFTNTNIAGNPAENLGLTYGNPIITKNKAGVWTVVFTSGLNNTTGDGKGYLYVLNAEDGSKVQEPLPTGEGSITSPSGLNRINGWVVDGSDNTALRFYGGDLLGNVWRFDTDARYSAAPSVLKLAKLQIDSTHPQPITTKPMLAETSGADVVVVGTGRYLGDTDITDTTQQSLYAIRDPLGATGWDTVRTDSVNFTKQTLTLNNVDASKATSASVSNNAVNWSKGGWWLDWPQPRERVAVNMGQQLNTLAIGTAVPTGDACASGGSSWRYYLNLGTGGVVAGESSVGVRWSPNNLIVGISWIKDASGNIRSIIQDSSGSIKTEVPPLPPSSTNAHRSSWRELID